ncbi:FadR/GntR family transcriptional regulator [Planctomycetota bacterium]
MITGFFIVDSFPIPEKIGRGCRIKIRTHDILTQVTMATQQNKQELFKLPRRPSNVDLVIGRIKELLLTGELQPGSRLPNESELAEGLGVSRGSIREAMKILSAFGIVHVKQGDGTYVATAIEKNLVDPLLFSLILSKGDKQNLLELRELIETGVVRFVVQNGTSEDLDVLEAEYLEMKEMVKAGNRDIPTLVEKDIAFHLALGKATNNPLLANIYSFILDFLKPSIETTLHNEQTPGKNALSAHKRILRALRSGDLDQSIEAIKASQRTWFRLYSNL